MATKWNTFWKAASVILTIIGFIIAVTIGYVTVKNKADAATICNGKQDIVIKENSNGVKAFKLHLGYVREDIAELKEGQEDIKALLK